MSCPNFETQRGYPLYLLDDSDMDWWEAQDFYNALQADIDAENENLTFFKLSIKGGYYCGAQFYVDTTNYADEAGFTIHGDEDATNEDCRYYLDMCLSEAKRKYAVERRKVCRLIEKIGSAWGFEHYYCTAIFFNGEAIYEKANKVSQIKAIARGAA